MKMVFAPPFKKGDKAYIISPSAGLLPFAPDRVARAKKHLEEIGYQVVIGKSAALNKGYISAGIDERVDDIHEAFSDKSCSLVLCSIGGNHSNQLIDKLDYELIRSNPKAFCGYSDITVLHLAILAKAGLTTYYGPTFLNQFGEYPKMSDFTLNHFRKTIMQEKNIITDLISKKYTEEVLDWFTGADGKRPRNLITPPLIEVWKHGKSKGKALAFAIPSINHVINTEYMPDANKAILFIDIPEGISMNVGMSVGEFDAWFSDLVRCGLIDNSSGIVIGRAYKYTTKMVADLKSVVVERCSSVNIPIIYGLDFGHTDPVMSIRYGSNVCINTKYSDIINFE